MMELNRLNERLNVIRYTNVIHMADLIMHRENYKNFNIATRKSIFNEIYQFAKRIPVK
jgi:hypothetical protein